MSDKRWDDTRDDAEVTGGKADGVAGGMPPDRETVGAEDVEADRAASGADTGRAGILSSGAVTDAVTGGSHTDSDGTPVGADDTMADVERSGGEAR